MESGTERAKLAVLWTTADRETVSGMVLPYALEAALSGRFETVRLAARGPSVRVMSGYGDMAQRIAELIAGGVEVSADSWGADMYGAAEALERMGVRLTDVGAMLTDMVCGGWQILSL